MTSLQHRVQLPHQLIEESPSGLGRERIIDALQLLLAQQKCLFRRVVCQRLQAAPSQKSQLIEHRSIATQLNRIRLQTLAAQ